MEATMTGFIFASFDLGAHAATGGGAMVPMRPMGPMGPRRIDGGRTDGGRTTGGRRAGCGRKRTAGGRRPDGGRAAAGVGGEQRSGGLGLTCTDVTGTPENI